jgi:hypothetical protein
MAESWLSAAAAGRISASALMPSTVNAATSAVNPIFLTNFNMFCLRDCRTVSGMVDR